MKLKLLVLLIVGLFLSDCAYKFSETSQTEENSNSSKAQIDRNGNNKSNDNVANTDKNLANQASKDENTGTENLILDGTSENAMYDCNGREVEIGKDATASNYTLKGECKKLTVDGVSNTVNVEKVGEISVLGVSNTVIYGEGLGGKKPKIKKSGVSASIDSMKSAQEKKAAQNK